MTLDLTDSARDLYARVVTDEIWGYRSRDHEAAAVAELLNARLIQYGLGDALYPTTARHGLTRNIDRQDGTSRQPNPAPTGDAT